VGTKTIRVGRVSGITVSAEMKSSFTLPKQWYNFLNVYHVVIQWKTKNVTPSEQFQNWIVKL
jgi:hypothetical protein